MWQSVSASLDAGGRFVAVIPELESDLTVTHDGRYEIDAVKRRMLMLVGRTGAKLSRHVSVQTETIHFDMFQLDRRVHERCAGATGMVDVKMRGRLNRLWVGMRMFAAMCRMRGLGLRCCLRRKLS